MCGVTQGGDWGRSVTPVAQSRHRGEHSEETSEQNHFFLVSELLCEGHDDEGDAREKVADVEEKETSEQEVSGPQYPAGLLTAPVDTEESEGWLTSRDREGKESILSDLFLPDGPDGGCEVPDGVEGGVGGHLGVFDPRWRGVTGLLTVRCVTNCRTGECRHH